MCDAAQTTRRVTGVFYKRLSDAQSRQSHYPASESAAIGDRSFIKIIVGHVMCGQQRNDGRRRQSTNDHDDVNRRTMSERQIARPAACLPQPGHTTAIITPLIFCSHCVPTSLHDHRRRSLRETVSHELCSPPRSTSTTPLTTFAERHLARSSFIKAYCRLQGWGQF